ALDETGRLLDLIAQSDEALEKFEEALKIVLEIKNGESPTSADLYNNIGAAYGSKGDLEKQLELYKKSLEVGISLYDSNHIQVGANYNNMGYNYAARGNYAASIPYFQKSLTIHLATYGEEHTYTTSNFMNLGFSFGQAGDYGKAFFYLDKALAGRLAVVGENSPEVADVYHNLAFFHGRIRNFQEERKNYRIALRIRENNFGDKHPLVGITKAMLGQTYTSTDDLDSALLLMQQGLDIIINSLGENHFYASVINYELGNCYARMDNFSKAETAFLKSRDIRIATGGPKHSDLPTLYLEMGTLYYLNENAEKARYFLNEGLKIQTIDYPTENSEYYVPTLDKVKKELITVLLLGHKAITYRKGDIQDLKYGQSLFLLADSLARTLRNSYEANVSKLALSNFINTTYFGGMDNALKLYEKDQDPQQFEYAFSFAEKGRATLLQETIHESKALVSGGIPPEIRNRESEIKVAMSYHEKIIFEEKQKKEISDSSRLVNSLNQQFDLAIEQQQLIEELESKFTKYYRLKYDHQIVTVADLQQKLQADEAMILFSVGERYVASFLIGKEHRDYHQFRFEDDWPHKTEAFIKLFNDEKRIANEGNSEAYFAEYTQSAYQLYQQILEPILSENTNIRKLIIVPDGLISYLPFDLLLTQAADKSSDYATLPYLMKDFQVRYAH
ncbi:MAG: tetratricopeptide repeat protein, partial [Bacteroidetes bacterium]|nr:tetratricopeptide repeat protein [Bacteroidota bacterium]